MDGQQDETEGEGAAALLGRSAALTPPVAAVSMGAGRGPVKVEGRAGGGGRPEGNGDGCDGAEGPLLDEARVMARIRDFYKEMLEAPVPEEMMKRMRALEKKESKE
jgi:hypothetical protein